MQCNWDAYVGEPNVDLPGNLMLYPVRPTSSASAHALEPAVECIPDFPGASFAGRATKLPDVLTT